MTATPLLSISEERAQRELRHALEHATPVITRRFVILTLVCLGWLLLGYFLLGLSFHLADPDRAEAAFLAGVLIGNAGPVWTLIIAQWLKGQY